MEDFKVGDKVNAVIDDAQFKNMVIVAINDWNKPFIYSCKTTTGTTRFWSASEITLVEPEPKFKVGDHVQLTEEGYQWAPTITSNEIGTIVIVDQTSVPYYVHFGQTLKYWLQENEIMLVPSLQDLKDAIHFFLTTEVYNAMNHKITPIAMHSQHKMACLLAFESNRDCDKEKAEILRFWLKKINNGGFYV